KEITKRWLPVNKYVGGAEHAVLHLMYSRFMTMALYDLKYLDFEEPFPSFYAHGLLIKNGAKMSKSRGNVVVPDEYIKKFGADTLRCYLMFLGPFDQGGDFRDTGIEGMYRFLNRVWRLFTQTKDVVLVEASDSREVLSKMHQTIKKVTKDIQDFKYNTAISSLMEFVNLLQEKAGGKVRMAKSGGIRCAEWDEALKTLVKLLAPFAPHMAEEVWVGVLGQEFSVHTSPWPKYDIDLAKETENVIVIQVDGRLRQQLTINSQQSTMKEEIEKIARKDSKVAKWLGGKKIKKTIFIPGKLINFVTR
ncbi:class I tRNA ligase family protein, partial [Candidatus Woesebacteria bacterium]|nr:class I tRNA ligase family protein [Candidatus Woesebacteria bacterium]